MMAAHVHHTRFQHGHLSRCIGGRLQEVPGIQGLSADDRDRRSKIRRAAAEVRQEGDVIRQEKELIERHSRILQLKMRELEPSSNVSSPSKEPLIKSIPKILRRYWDICGVALLVR